MHRKLGLLANFSILSLIKLLSLVFNKLDIKTFLIRQISDLDLSRLIFFALSTSTKDLLRLIGRGSASLTEEEVEPSAEAILAPG